MEAFFGFLFLSSLVLWVGSIAFFSTVAAPAVTAAWPPPQAARAVAPMARSYLRLGWICGLLALVSSFFLPSPEGTFVTTRILVVAVMFLLALYLALGPGAQVRRAVATLEQAGEGDLPPEVVTGLEEFRAAAEQLNGALLLLAAVVVFITAFYG